MVFAFHLASKAAGPVYVFNVELSHDGFELFTAMSEYDFWEIKIKENTKQIVPICFRLSKRLHVCVCVCV